MTSTKGRDFHRVVRQSSVPEVGPFDAEFLCHQPQARHADSHHGVRVALDFTHECGAQTVDGEGPRHVQGFPCGDVGVDFGIADIGKVHRGNADQPGRGTEFTTPMIDQPVSRRAFLNARAVRASVDEPPRGGEVSHK